MKFDMSLVGLAAAITAVQAAAVGTTQKEADLSERLTSFIASDDFKASAETGDDLDVLINWVEEEREANNQTESSMQKRAVGGKDDDKKIEVEIKGDFKGDHDHKHDHDHSEHKHKHGHGHKHEHGEHKHKHDHGPHMPAATRASPCPRAEESEEGSKGVMTKR